MGKQFDSPEKAPTITTDRQTQASNKIQKLSRNINENETNISAILENRPNITLTSNTIEENTRTNSNTTTSPIKKPVPQPNTRFLKSSGAPSPCKPQPIPSIFCPICQTSDSKCSTIKTHMESKREVQCKACGLYFGNCYTLGKHMKGRCREKRTKQEKQAKASQDNSTRILIESSKLKKYSKNKI